jgi:hypothetical protein
VPRRDIEGRRGDAHGGGYRRAEVRGRGAGRRRRQTADIERSLTPPGTLMARQAWPAERLADSGQRAASKAVPTAVASGPGLNSPVVPLPAETGSANQA